MARRRHVRLALGSALLLFLVAVMASTLNQAPPAQAQTPQTRMCSSDTSGTRENTGPRTLRVGSDSNYSFRLSNVFQPKGTPDGDVTVTVTSSDVSVAKVTNHATMHIPTQTKEGWTYFKYYRITPVSAGNATLTFTVTKGNNLCAVGTHATRKLHVLPKRKAYKLQLDTPDSNKLPNKNDTSQHTFSLSDNPRGTLKLLVTVDPSGVVKVSPEILLMNSNDWGNRQVTVTAVGTGTATVTYTVTGDESNHYGVGTSISRKYTVGTPPPPPPPVGPAVTIASDGNVDEGKPVSYTITASPPPTAPLWVALEVDETSFGTNVFPDVNEGIHYVKIPKGQASATFTHRTQNDYPGATKDDYGDTDSKVAVTIRPGTGYHVGDPKKATVTVTDDDRRCIAGGYERRLFVSYNRLWLVMGNQAHTPYHYEYKLASNPGAPVTISVAATGNIVTLNNSTLTFDEDNWNTAQTVEVTPSALGSGQLTVAVTIADTNAVNCATSDKLTLALKVYKPAVRITAGPIVTEADGAMATFTVRAGEQGWHGERLPRRNPAERTFRDAAFRLNAPLTVNVDVSEAAGDYVDGSDERRYTVTIPMGKREETLRVPLQNDSNVENDGTVVATLAEPQSGDGYVLYQTSLGYELDSAATPVQDDDPVDTQMSMSSDAISEGDSRDVLVSIGSPMQSGMSVTLPITGSGTATRGTDYNLQCPSPLPKGVTCNNLDSSSGTVKFSGSADGSATQVTLKLNVQSDGVDDDGETVDLGIGAPVVVGSGGGASVVDDAPAVTLNNGAPQQQRQKEEPLVVDVRSYVAETNRGTAHVERWKRVLIGLGVETYPGLTAMTASEARKYSDFGWTRWDPVVIALEKIEAASVTPPPPPPTPKVTITAGQSVTEGTGAIFTITASPAPSSTLTVSVDVTQSGDFATSGTQTATIGSGGSATLNIATTDDSTDEPDGSVTATLQAGNGYTIGSASAATVAVSDDDDPTLPPAYTPPADLVADVRSYVAETHHGSEHVDRWKRVLIGLGVETYAGLTAMTSTEARTYADRGWTRWDPVVTELQKAEAATVQPPPPPPDPTISIVAGPDVTEGGNAIFTLTASPAPTSPLTVSVDVAQSGDFASVGARTATLTGATASLVVATIDDAVDEADGSVTATLQAGSGYTVGSSSSATIAVSDNDDPPPPPPVMPELTITKGADITEGSDAVFTINADRAPTAPLTVSINVSQSGDFATVGSQSATLDSTSTTLTVVTIDDAVDEADGSVTATLQAGSGYTVGASSAATIAVLDDDDAPPPPADPEITITGGAGVSEGQDAVFTLSASPAATSTLTVHLSVSQQGDFASSLPATVTLTGGAATLRIGTVDDGTDEPDGSITAALASGSGYTLGGSSSATVAVSDDDPAPPPDTRDSSVKADLIARMAALVDEYRARRGESSQHFLVSFRAGETLSALEGESSMASDPALAPYHFRAAITAAMLVGDDDAAALFAEARDFLGVREL